MNREQAILTLRAQEPELRKAGLSSLYLFGSLARGDNGPKSDVDLACEIDHNKKMGLFGFAGIMIDLEALLGVPVDLVERNAMRPRIKKHAEADMVRVF